MPMVGDALGAAIKAKITAIPGVNVTSDSELTSFCNAIGEAVVLYLQTNAVVLPTALLSATPGAPVTGVGSLS